MSQNEIRMMYGWTPDVATDLADLTTGLAELADLAAGLADLASDLSPRTNINTSNPMGVSI